MSSSFNPIRIPMKSKWLASILEKILGLKALIKLYEERPRKDNGDNVDSQRFLQYALDALHIHLQIKNEALLQTIPKEGPVVFVSNHPLGGLEGIAMSHFLLKYRPDTLVLTNQMLRRIPELSDIFIGVDVLSQNAAKENSKSIRQVYSHLENGGAILIYPAGRVSAINKKTWKVEDIQWNNLVGRLLKKYQAACMPFYVKGRNSRLFYLTGLIHKRLRTILLPRQLVNKKGMNLEVCVGHVITPDEIKHLETPSAITHYLRVATDLLAIPETVNEEPKTVQILESDTTNRHSQEQISQCLSNLSDYLLQTKGSFSVYCAPYDRLGVIMDEIAYAREETFRAAGEGTGFEKDSDRFDPYYLHLFLWDNELNRLVGGYRIGRTNEIVAERGINALYSRLLYQFDEAYIERLGMSLEMGRSFIKPSYQRHPKALDMLWRGIGTYIAKNPEYHTLFGCVSISDEHSELAKAFLSDSMMESFRAQQEFLNDVRPTVPLKVKGKLWTKEALASLSNVVVINKLLGRCDPGKSIPILLRQYLALNGRFVCFSVNTGFNNSLDGLILVDLRKTPQKYLQRYLGKEGSQKFLEKWVKDECVA